MVFKTTAIFRLLIGLGCLFGIGLFSSQSMALGKGNDTNKNTYLMWHLIPVEGATPELADKIERSIRQHFKKHHKKVLMNVINMDSTLLVEGNEKYLRCGTGSACLSGFAKVVKANRVIAGEVSMVAGRISVKLVLLNVKSQKFISTSKVSFKRQPGAKQLKELEIAMFEPKRYQGSLQVDTQVGGAEVWLDGVKMGITPLIGPLPSLSVGEHRLEVKKAGHETFARIVNIPLGESVVVNASLNPLEGTYDKPFYKRWIFWTAAGVGVAGIVTAVFLHDDALALQDSADACWESGMTCYGPKQEQADSRFMQSYVFYGIGGAGLIAATAIAVVELVFSEPTKPWVVNDGLVFGVSPGPQSVSVNASWRF